MNNWLDGRIERPALVHVALIQPTDVLARLSSCELQAQGRTRY